MKTDKKGEVITFKVDGNLAQALSGLPNRSEFIRASIMNALERACPLCRGAGVITAEQRTLWDEFLAFRESRSAGR